MASTSNNVLVSWIGANDLKAVNGGELGPIASTQKAELFDSLELLYAYPKDQVDAYLAWLATQAAVPVVAHAAQLSSPVNFAEIYQHANQHLRRVAASARTLSILMDDLLGLPAFVPKLEILDKFANVVRAYKNALGTIISSSRGAQIIFKSLSQKAFSGEL